MAERDKNDGGTGSRQDTAQREPATNSTTPPMEGAVGASDATSGGAAGAGIPDADLAQRAGDAVTRGDVDKDREKVFPEADESRPGEDARR